MATKISKIYRVFAVNQDLMHGIKLKLNTLTLDVQHIIGPGFVNLQTVNNRC